jgi:Methyl-CpG binding domain
VVHTSHIHYRSTGSRSHSHLHFYRRGVERMESCKPHVSDSSSSAEDSISAMSCTFELQSMKQPPSEVPSPAAAPLKSIMKAPSLAQKRAQTAGKIQGWWKRSQKINISEQQKVLAARKLPETSTTIGTKVSNDAKEPVGATLPPVAMEVLQTTDKEVRKIMPSESDSVEPMVLDVSPLPIAPLDVTPSKSEAVDKSHANSSRTKKRVAAKSIITATLDLALIDRLIQNAPSHNDRFSGVPRKTSSRPPTEVSIPTSMHTPQHPVPAVATRKAVGKTKRKKADVSDPAQASVKTAPKTKKRKPNPQVWEGVPDDVVAFEIDWQSGWIKRGFKRSSGASKDSVDYYWYTPKHGYRLRSIKEVERFVNLYNANNLDEEVAHRLLKK